MMQTQEVHEEASKYLETYSYLLSDVMWCNHNSSRTTWIVSRSSFVSLQLVNSFAHVGKYLNNLHARG